MTTKSLGFIGGGRIVRIFLEGWKRAGQLPGNIVVSDCNADALSKLKGQFPSIETAVGKPHVAAAQDVVFLAVHPPVMAETAVGIKGSLKPGAIVVSLAPLGEFPEVAEPKLEGYALLSAMGPTYFWFQMQALREVAAGFGLSEAEIAPALKRMVCGGARTLLESGLTATEVMDLIPVKPLAEMEAQVSEMYRTRLPGLYQKIKP